MAPADLDKLVTIIRAPNEHTRDVLARRLKQEREPIATVVSSVAALRQAIAELSPTIVIFPAEIEGLETLKNGVHY